MSDHEANLYEIDVCERVLRGETVNGVRLGDVGITREFVEGMLKMLRRMEANMPPATQPPPSEKYSIYDTRIRPSW